MHDLIFGTKDSGWRDIVAFKRTSDQFLDRFILGADPIWHAIETNQLHLRNSIGKQILTGKGPRGNEYITRLNEKLNTEIFEGKRRLILKDPDKIADVDPHIITLTNNLNRAWQMTEGAKGTKGEKEITVEEMKSLHEDISREVGSLFTNDNNFIAFKNYLDLEFVDSMLGSGTSYGAKKALASLIQDTNPLGFSDQFTGNRILATGKAIREQILGSDYGVQMQRTDPNFATEVERMVNRYEKEIVQPSNGKGVYLEFSDVHKIDRTSNHSAKDWMQQLIGIDAKLDGSKIVDLSRVANNLQALETMAGSFNTAAHYEQLAKVAINKLTLEEFQASMNSLLKNTRNLNQLVLSAVQNNDSILWGQIVDAQYDIIRSSSS